jgi:hypothetical protein
VVWLLGFEEANGSTAPLPVEPVLTSKSSLALSSPPPPPPVVAVEDKNLLRAGIVGCGFETLDVVVDDDELGVGVCCCWTFGKFSDDSESWFFRYDGLTGGAGFLRTGFRTGDS